MQDIPRKKLLASLPVQRWGLALAVAWTLLVAAIFGAGFFYVRHRVVELALREAKTHHDKDIVYRQWAASHGGVYVPVTEKTPPNPYLVNVVERDLVTPSGRRLTLMNPSYMTRQAQELGAELYGVRGHITSLKPIRPENAADAWETMALQAFEKGSKEFSTIEKLNGTDYLRLMYPFITDKSCLKCHAGQGYREGDVRGGISVSVPMASYYKLRDEELLSLGLVCTILLLLGQVGLWTGVALVAKRTREREQAVNSLLLDEERFRSLLAVSAMKEATERELLDFAVEEVVRLTNSQVGYLHFYDDDRRIIRLYAWSTNARQQCTLPGMELEYPLDKAGVWADCIRLRQPVIHNDYPGLPDKKGCPDGHFPVSRQMSVPIIDQERIVAIAGVGNKETPYDDGDRVQISLYMNSIWEIVKNLRAECRLVQQEDELRLFRSLIDQSYDAVFVISPRNGRFLDVNDQACQALGYSRQELLALGVMDIEAGQAPDFSWEDHLRELRQRDHTLLIGTHRRKDGTTFPVEVNIRIITHADSEYMIAVARDITERQAAEAELLHHREQLEDLVRERTSTLEEKTRELEQSRAALQNLLEDVNEAKQKLEEKNLELDRFNKLFVDRELKMVELKERIRILEEQQTKGAG